MRKTLDEDLTLLARSDNNIYLLVCDLGNFPLFSKEFPERFINCGIQETGMVSIAVGLASQGKKVFLYAVAGFVLFRAHEQLKLNVGYQNLPITLINGGAGLVYHLVGRGHYIVEDISLVRTFPNFSFCMPRDIPSFREYLNKAYTSKNPYFIRLGKDNCPDVLDSDLNVSGISGVIYTTNTCLHEVISANKILRKHHLDFSIKCVEDLDLRRPNHLSNMTCVVVEDHIPFGGLASFLRDKNVKVHKHICLPMLVDKTTESYSEILSYYGLDAKSISESVMDYLDVSY